MDAGELADVVAQLSEAVGRAGFPDRPHRLGLFEADLRCGDPERLVAARQGLQGVVHGMSGLHDIYYGSADETRRVTHLIDLMWREIKAEN